jgi:UDP:flavonoid glycosyltransferase YjiC (YdhE family)
VRVLCTTQPASGHFHPLVPVARALVAAGHEVRFACSPSFCPDIAASGFAAIPAGLDWLEAAFLATFPRFGELLATAGLPVAAAWASEAVFAGATAERMAPDLLALARDWPPDLVVREPMEFGGYLAAEALGLPHATVEVGSFDPYTGHDGAVARSLDRLRAAHGLPPDPDLARPYHYLHLSAAPPGYQDPAVPLPPTAHALRPVVFDRSGEEGLPPWVADLPARPTVYATLGTVVNRRPGALPAIIAGLRDEPFNLVVTTGRNQDPDTFGPQPPNVHLARYIPQSALLPRCDLVVSHAGFNTVVAGIAHGLPQVAIPLGADQPDHARRVARLGLGRVVAPGDFSPEAVREAVRAVLADPTYRRNAERLRDEMAALPGPERGVALLERLAAERRPIIMATG